MKRRFRRWWSRHVHRADGEICDDCGLPVVVPWLAPDRLWERVVGKPDLILCVFCFDRRATALEIFVHWVPAEW